MHLMDQHTLDRRTHTELQTHTSLTQMQTSYVASSNLTEAQLTLCRTRDKSLLANKPLEVIDYLFLIDNDGFSFSNDLQFSNIFI